MKIVITSKKPLLTASHGRLAKDAVIDLPDHLAQFFIDRNEAVRYETKVAQERPTQAAGKVEQLSALPVAQASQSQTLSASESGARRGRKNQKV